MPVEGWVKPVLAAMILLVSRTSSPAQAVSEAAPLSIYQPHPRAHPLYNGRQYAYTQPRAKGHPFLYSVEWAPGGVIWNGQLLETCLLRYDTQKDRLTVLADTFLGIGVVVEPASAPVFFLNKEEFVYQSPGPGGKTGYFLRAYHDSIHTVWFRFEKQIQQENRQNSIEWGYIERRRVYLQTPQGIQQLSGKGDLVRAFDSRRKELKKYMKQEEFAVKRASPAEMRALFYFLKAH